MTPYKKDPATEKEEREGEEILKRCPTDLMLIGWDGIDEEVDA